MLSTIARMTWKFSILTAHSLLFTVINLTSIRYIKFNGYVVLSNAWSWTYFTELHSIFHNEELTVFDTSDDYFMFLKFIGHKNYVLWNHQFEKIPLTFAHIFTDNHDPKDNIQNIWHHCDSNFYIWAPGKFSK